MYISFVGSPCKDTLKIRPLQTIFNVVGGNCIGGTSYDIESGL